MKVIKFSLPINGTSVNNLEELRVNLTDEILALARSSQLERWLRTRQLLELAQAVAAALQKAGSEKDLFLALCKVLEVQVHPDDVKAIFDVPPAPGRLISGARYFELYEELRRRVFRKASESLMDRSLRLVSRAKPVIALVGGCGAGKSTLFNRLINSYGDVGNESDCHYGSSRLGRNEYVLIDTPGFESAASRGMVDQAVAGSDAVIFVVNASSGGLSPENHEIVHYLCRFAKPTLVLANKRAKHIKVDSQLVEFYELGLDEVITVSVKNDLDVRTMLESVLDKLF